MNTLLLGISVLPVIVLLAYIYQQDQYEKEPLGMLLKALLFGALSTFPAILLEQLISSYNIFHDHNPVLAGLFDGFCVAGFSEELCKLCLLWLCVWNNRHFNEYFDGIVYAACVALGFACVENINYVFSSGDYLTALHTGIMRAILSVPGHFLFGISMGYYFAFAKFRTRHRAGYLLAALFVPALLHGTFDALLMIPENMGGNAGIVSSLMFCIFIWFDIKLWKIGRKRLLLMQQETLKQAQAEDPFATHAHTSDHGTHSTSENNPFDHIDWNV